MALTPLHVSVGYNRVEIVKFLLNRQGTDKVELDAKNMNGITPLNHTVWYSLRAEDCSTVNTLLKYNAGCSAKDNVRWIAII
ncbi:poly [ADP-ribose] polymerase tankyrase-2-like [Juglans microcarpa x Juglans regia]|uniref:poly [ADP-ribose] polymerase tankyrase-2-like n=1 Tax=Juglans microcarpa x Juglans regia TaxID=2249226 RepID=UPI001B7E853F|nr:poly [ADP-ribose] polymerase tankyrase-2-like [Juglans microcarpa x Juglans regia]